MKITIENRRYDLGTMVALGCSSLRRGGIRTEEMYFGPRSHRLIVQTDSSWNNGTGCRAGRGYAVYEPDHEDWVRQMTEALRLCGAEHEDMLRASMDQHAPALAE